MSFTLSVQDGTSVAAAQESAGTGWRELELILRGTDANGPFLFKLGPVRPVGGKFAVTTPADMTAITKVELIAARQHGPHHDPIEWRPDQPIEVTDGQTLPAIPERLRITAWAPPVALMAKNNGHPIMDAQGYFSIRDEIIRSPCEGLDEMSVISTVFLTGDILDPGHPTIAIDWADDFPNPNTVAYIKQQGWDLDAIRLDFLHKIIATLHAKRVQVFAGFYVDTGNHDDFFKVGPTQSRITERHAARLVELLQNSNLQMRDFANCLVDFFESRGLEIDGIWFDFEVGGFKTPGLARSLNAGDEPRMRELVYEVSRALAAGGRYLAFASAHDQAQALKPPGPPNMQRHFYSHPSSLARLPNVITRPMSYDNGRFNTIVQAYGHYQVLPQHLQIGVGIGGGTTLVNDQMKLGAPRFRDNRCGLIHWAFNNPASLQGYVEADKIMNQGAPPHGTFGQPIQGPLNRQRLEVMQAAITAARAADDPDLVVAPDVVIPDDAP